VTQGHALAQAGLLKQALQPPEDAGADAQPVEAGGLGMYLWPEPIASRASDGTEVNTLVLEVEGLGSDDALGGRHDRMFALSALLASFMVYTTTGALSDEAVDRLWARCAFLVDSVRVSSEEQHEHAEELADEMPKLLWLLHNFSLGRTAVEVVADRTPSPQVASARMTPGGTPRQYLEKALEDLGGLSVRASASCRGKRKARASLRRLFLDRDCFPLSAAGGAPDDSRGPFSTPETPAPGGGARLPSRRQLLALRDRVLSNAEVKAVSGAPLCGRMLAALAEAYVSVFNAGASPPPCIADVWATVCDAEFARHQAAALAAYDAAAAALRARMPLGSSELSQWHAGEARRAHVRFGDGGAALQAKRRHRQVAQLEEHLTARWDALCAQNARVGEDGARALVGELLADVELRLASGELADFAAFERERRRARAAFLERAPRHPAALAVLHEFMEDAVSAGAARCAARAARAAQAAEGALRGRVAELEAALGEARAAAAQAASDARARAGGLEEALAAGRAREEALAAEAARTAEAHAAEVREVAQAHAGALRAALAELDDARRARAAAELAAQHAHDRVDGAPPPPLPPVLTGHVSSLLPY
jgi:hypothetical protein